MGKPMTGVENIRVDQGMSMKMTWTASELESDEDNDQNKTWISAECEMTMAKTKTSSKMQGKPKEHIIWNVDQKALNEYFEQNRQDAPEILHPHEDFVIRN